MAVHLELLSIWSFSPSGASFHLELLSIWSFFPSGASFHLELLSIWSLYTISILMVLQGYRSLWSLPWLWSKSHELGIVKNWMLAMCSLGITQGGRVSGASWGVVVVEVSPEVTV